MKMRLKTIFNLYSSDLYNVANRILGGVADSEEVVQDVCWIAYHKAHSFRGNWHLSTWLYRLRISRVRLSPYPSGQGMGLEVLSHSRAR